MTYTTTWKDPAKESITAKAPANQDTASCNRDTADLSIDMPPDLKSVFLSGRVQDLGLRVCSFLRALQCRCLPTRCGVEGLRVQSVDGRSSIFRILEIMKLLQPKDASSSQASHSRRAMTSLGAWRKQLPLGPHRKIARNDFKTSRVIATPYSTKILTS